MKQSLEQSRRWNINYEARLLVLVAEDSKESDILQTLEWWYQAMFHEGCFWTLWHSEMWLHWGGCISHTSVPLTCQQQWRGPPPHHAFGATVWPFEWVQRSHWEDYRHLATCWWTPSWPCTHSHPVGYTSGDLNHCCPKTHVNNKPTASTGIQHFW